MTFPDDPVAFLQDCTAWWEWLGQAHPDAIDRYPENGHIKWRWQPWRPPVLSQGGRFSIEMSYSRPMVGYSAKAHEGYDSLQSGRYPGHPFTLHRILEHG